MRNSLNSSDLRFCMLFLIVLLAGCTRPMGTQPVYTAPVQPVSVTKTETIRVEQATEPAAAVPTTTADAPQCDAQENENEIYLEYSSVSPEGEWAAVLVGNGEQTTLRVFNQGQGYQKWTISEPEDEDRRSVPWPLSWSQDGNYLYYTHQFRDGDGCFGYWASNGSDLNRLNLESGEAVQLANDIGHWLAMSPDETSLAFLSGGQVGILDLQSGERRTSEVVTGYEPTIYTYPMNIVWSPDGKTLMIGLLVNPCVDEDADRHSLILIDATSLEQEIIIQESSEWLEPISWPNPDQVLIRDWAGKFWWLNPLTRQLIEKK